MRIGLVRHFEVILSFQKLVTSSEFEELVRQYDMAEVRQSSIDLGNTNWELCFSSDLPRAIQTAQSIGNCKIVTTDYLREVPKESRFGVSPDEQDKFVFPSLADSLGLLTRVVNGQAQVRRPTEMEFNFAGNLRYPHLGQANTWEWMQDHFEDARRLFGGDSGLGGLAYVYYDWHDYRHDDTAFRPGVVFLPQAA